MASEATFRCCDANRKVVGFGVAALPDVALVIPPAEISLDEQDRAIIVAVVFFVVCIIVVVLEKLMATYVLKESNGKYKL